MNNFTKELETAVNIAREAGVIMLKYFDEDQHIEIKKDDSQVTIADKLINSLVIKRLAEAFPEDGVIGEEESNSEYGGGRKWFCDPIDGTEAYVWGVPTAMFSLGLVIDGKPVVGVAYDPFLNKMYTGIKDQKSFCNGKVLSVSNTDLKDGILAIASNIKSILTRPYYQKMIDDKIRLAPVCGVVYKCCLIARGKFTGNIQHGVSAHDMAAVEVIVKEAGGKITSVEGKELDYTKPFKGAVVSNGIAHDQIIKYGLN